MRFAARYRYRRFGVQPSEAHLRSKSADVTRARGPSSDSRGSCNLPGFRLTVVPTAYQTFGVMEPFGQVFLNFFSSHTPHLN